jgi:sporulation protein YlmC with PRC-barrel domain
VTPLPLALVANEVKYVLFLSFPAHILSNTCVVTMGKRLSELYGMDIFTQKAQYVGKVEDVILNLDKGEVMRLCLQSFKGGGLSSDDIKRVLSEESISYDDVVEVGDIILTQKAPAAPKAKSG